MQLLQAATCHQNGPSAALHGKLTHWMDCELQWDVERGRLASSRGLPTSSTLQLVGHLPEIPGNSNNLLGNFQRSRFSSNTTRSLYHLLYYVHVQSYTKAHVAHQRHRPNTGEGRPVAPSDTGV